MSEPSDSNVKSSRQSDFSKPSSDDYCIVVTEKRPHPVVKIIVPLGDDVIESSLSETEIESPEKKIRVC